MICGQNLCTQLFAYIVMWHELCDRERGGVPRQQETSLNASLFIIYLHPLPVSISPSPLVPSILSFPSSCVLLYNIVLFSGINRLLRRDNDSQKKKKKPQLKSMYILS